LLPWSAFFYPALVYQFKNLKEDRDSRLFLLSWALAPIIFFSLSLNYKIARYILPALPALAIIIGKLWHDYFENQEKAEKAIRVSNYLNLFLILPALVILVMVAIFMFPKEQAAYQPIVFPTLSLLTLGILISIILIFKQKKKLAFFGLLTSALIAYLVLIGSLSMYFNEANPMAYLSKKIGITARLQDQVGIYIGSGTSTINFYSNHKAVLINQDEDLKAFLKQKKKVYLLTEQPKRLEDFSKKHAGLVKIVEKKNYMILFSN